ncbi:hypothetical protein ALQ39_100841 [Pseudomonas amygdali pv. eriobotryae]|uniref:Uncharacterized protein n=1 Tax=Pseudomonas amygdali pv. eriobotryae TaxID=129137 RepID=A0A3M3XBV2_PSEA0|nr:hypothetical protein ALQ39_100841 [Pseudomonas amygdali pv. eriobotryae]
MYSAFYSSCSWSFFDEYVGAASNIVTTTDNSVSHRTHVQLDGANGVIVARDDVVNAFRAAVGIDNADNRDAQLVGFGDRDALVINVDNEQCVWQTAHILDTTQAAIQFFQITGAHQGFFLGQLGESTVFGLHFQLAQTLDRLTNGLEVGQHATQPAMVDVRRTATCCFFSNDFASGTLGADEQNLVFARSQALNESQGFVEHRQGFFKVDDVNLVTRAENVLTHFRVPVTGLVTEVHTGLQHIAHIDLGHDSSLISRVRPPRIPMTNQWHLPRAPRSSCRHVCGFVLQGRTLESGAFYITKGKRTELPSSSCFAVLLKPYPLPIEGSDDYTAPAV